MFAGKPIIGIIGGIGSGKSYVARIFGELGCLVIDSDAQVAQVYRRPDIQETLKSWWGQEVLDGQNGVNRAAIARRVFTDPQQRRRLENLIHPIVARMRMQTMQSAAHDPRILAYVWDTPLLVETGLHRQCDALVFVDAPDEQRFDRVSRNRGWTREDWLKREKIQLPLDNKRQIANDMVRNTAGADNVRSQVREVLSRIVAGRTDGER